MTFGLLLQIVPYVISYRGRSKSSLTVSSAEALLGRLRTVYSCAHKWRSYVAYAPEVSGIHPGRATTVKTCVESYAWISIRRLDRSIATIRR